MKFLFLSNPASLMKKIYASLGIVLAATLSLTNCTKQLESPVEIESDGIPFEVSALLTKTTNDGMSTKWASSDAINLFHAEAGTETYVSDGEFTVDKALTGTFSGTLASALDKNKAYDWYAIYPYNRKIVTPAATDKGYVTVGGTTQTQKGNDVTSHLSGSACPLYGVATRVSASDSPSFAMKHLTSVVCVEVTNKLESSLTVSSIAFTSSEDIVGTYYVNFTGSAPVYTRSGDTYVSKTANLTVTGGKALAKDESAKFYIAIKPHTAASGSTLKLSVNGVEKTVTLSNDAAFEAGKIKNLTFSYDSAPAGLSLPFEETFEVVKKSNTSEIKTASDLFTSNFASKFISFSSVYGFGTDGEVKLGASSKAGIIVTKALDLSAASVVTVRAKAFDSDKTIITVSINGQKKDSSTLTSEYVDYSFELAAATSSESVTITSKNKSKNRFYVDSITIKKK